jgi:hypothetical protein
MVLENADTETGSTISTEWAVQVRAHARIYRSDQIAQRLDSFNDSLPNGQNATGAQKQLQDNMRIDSIGSDNHTAPE